MSGLLAGGRARLVALLLLATVAVSVLVVSAAGSSLSYYVTPEEFAQQLDVEGKRWRVGGRVVAGTVVERNGRPVSFLMEGEGGERMTIAYDGIVPGLFGPGAFVVVEGGADGPRALTASSVIVKHENEFVTEASATMTAQ